MRTRLILIFLGVLAVALVGACGGEPLQYETEQALACAARAGAYRAHFVARAGGTCGTIADTVADAAVMLPIELGAGCTGRGAPLDSCSARSEVVCHADGIGRSMTWRSTSSWQAAGGLGSAVATLTIRRGRKTECESVYDVSFVKLPVFPVCVPPAGYTLDAPVACPGFADCVACSATAPGAFTTIAGCTPPGRAEHCAAHCEECF